MTPEERTLISSLFDRLVQASNQPKDSEAEQLIRGKVSENPAAPYLLAQSTLVLQQALTNAQNRISDLEKQLTEAQTQSASKPGGFLSGVAGFFLEEASQKIHRQCNVQPLSRLLRRFSSNTNNRTSSLPTHIHLNNKRVVVWEDFCRAR